MRTREIHLASRPAPSAGPDNFALVEVDLPDPADGQLLVRNTVMSVDPYMRGRMNDVKSYVPPFQVGAPLEGGVVGEVIESTVDKVPVGSLVLHGLGWREHALLSASAVQVIEPVAGVSASHYLGALGMPGLTAYVGLLDVAEFAEGDTVFVSGAAGAVGAMVGQIARLRGASRVIGSAGSAAKIAHLTEKLGFDVAFNYRDGDVGLQLADAAPAGIDVYFDNVGGEHLQAAIARLNVRGRVAMCGAISSYDIDTPPAGPGNLGLAIGKRLTLRGFIVTDHYDRFPAMAAEVGGWLTGGQLVAEETVVAGLENAPQAFLGLLRGDNTGKMVVTL